MVFGASVGLDLPEHGFRDAVDYPEALRARRYYPLHHDYGTADGSSSGVRPPLQAEMDARPDLEATLEWLQDPGDYLRPIVFDPAAPEWRA